MGRAPLAGHGTDHAPTITEQTQQLSAAQHGAPAVLGNGPIHAPCLVLAAWKPSHGAPQPPFLPPASLAAHTVSIAVCTQRFGPRAGTHVPASCSKAPRSTPPACDSISSEVPWQHRLSPLLHTDHLQAGSWGRAAEPWLCQRHVAAGTGEQATGNSSCTWHGQDCKVILSSTIGIKTLAEILALSCSGLPPNCSREIQLSWQGKDVLNINTS